MRITRFRNVHIDHKSTPQARKNFLAATITQRKSIEQCKNFVYRILKHHHKKQDLLSPPAINLQFIKFQNVKALSVYYSKHILSSFIFGQKPENGSNFLGE